MLHGMREEQEIASYGRRRQLWSGFRKSCRSQFRLQTLRTKRLRKSPRTCFEGPFGEVLRATGPMAKANPFKFSTKYQDDESDLLYYGERYYCASAGRWVSRDPIEEEGGENLYGFVQGDPISSTDPLGQSILDIFRSCKTCKCKSVNISYTPKLKDGKLQFKVYKNPNSKGKQYGFILHVYWNVDGNGSLCTYGVNEPAGGLAGTDPKGTVQPSDGTGGLWRSVPQKWDDHPGIPVSSKGQYSISVNLTQTYGCWDSGVDASSQPPSATVGPMNYTGSGTTKY
jgi:RHS repeat-associated protein